MTIRPIAAIAAAAGFAAAASAGIITYSFGVTTTQSVPAPTIPSGFAPVGFGVVNLNTDARSITWEITYQGLTGPIVAPGAHFHGPADFGETGGIQVDIAGDAAGTDSGLDLPLPVNGVLLGGYEGLTDQQIDDITAGLWYVNIHTELNPAGEIRGQVIPAPGAIAALGLGGMIATRRRR